MEIVNSLKRVKRRGRHARLPRKAVEPRCYICVHLVYLCFKRLVPTEENQGRNDQDYNQQSSHDHRDWQNLTVEVNLISVITRAQSETVFYDKSAVMLNGNRCYAGASRLGGNGGAIGFSA